MLCTLIVCRRTPTCSVFHTLRTEPQYLQTYVPSMHSIGFFLFCFFIILLGKFRPAYFGKATAALPSPAGFFRVSVVHRTLTRTWITGSLTCVCHHSFCERILLGGWAQRETLFFFSCAPDGVRTSGIWI